MNSRKTRKLSGPVQKGISKEEIMASFQKFMKGKNAADIFPESNRRAYLNLTKAGLI
jgi:hypothetical protein